MLKKFILTLLTVSLISSTVMTTRTFASENTLSNHCEVQVADSLSIKRLADDSLSFEIDNFGDDFIHESINIDNQEYTVTIQDVTPISERNSINEYWGIGTRTKKVTLSSLTATLTATFTISMNPYTSTVSNVTGGDYTSALGALINDWYEYPGYGSEGAPAVGHYWAKYTTYVGGTFNARLSAYAYAGSDGKVTFTAVGI